MKEETITAEELISRAAIVKLIRDDSICQSRAGCTHKASTMAHIANLIESIPIDSETVTEGWRDIIDRQRELITTQEDINNEIRARVNALEVERDALRGALEDLIHQLPTDERLADFNLDRAEAALAGESPEGN